MATIEFVTWPVADEQGLIRRLVALEKHLPRPEHYTADEREVLRRFQSGEFPLTSIGHMQARLHYGRN